MKITSTALRLGVAAVVAGALVAGSASAALAATTATTGSKGPLFIVSNESGELVTADTQLTWETDVVGSSTSTYGSVFAGPDASAGATDVYTFVAPRGMENNPREWSTKAAIGFGTDGVNVKNPNVTLSNQIVSVKTTPAGLKASGGAYSVGVAFTKDNGFTVVNGFSYFAYVDITPGTGAWTFATPSSDNGGNTGGNNGGTTTDPSLTGDIALEASTVAAQDGALSLAVASGAKATIGSPKLENQLSKSTGSLPEFQVVDQRVVSRKGWTLTANVADFSLLVNGVADSSKKIDGKQLGTSPKVVTTGTTATGVTAGAAQAAGSANKSFSFASAAAGAGVGTTVLGGDLTFVAPAEAVAGTYTSKMTLTLVSK